MAKAKYCVFVGRFQPFHNAHLKVLLKAFTEAENVIVVVGSYRTASNIKNPWTFEDRRQMIESSVPPELLPKLTVIPLRDFTYNDTAWVTALQNAVSQITGSSPDVYKSKIIGCFKDDSSYYLSMFPQWELVQEPYYDGLDATDIRKALFEGPHWNKVQKLVPEGAFNFIRANLGEGRWKVLKNEYDFYKEYKKKWADSPFPPTFMTVDAIVTKASHVLLVKRGINPGKGKYALPGGFLGQHETTLAGAIRELKEETGILFPSDQLPSLVVNSHLFDHPSRDLRGRTITHAFHFNLPVGGPLPDVKGADDAAEAVWVSFNDLALLEESFFSDHLHIINYFVSKV